MILILRGRNGDSLAIDTATNAYYLSNFARDHFEGRASAIEGVVGSICTTGVSRAYVKAECRRVPRATVPEEWRRAIGL